jgi:CO/xanthine dehydrogenase Mo-binding subunit
VAEVEVDPETGRVKVLGFVAAQDCGRAINPLGVEGQIEGSVSMGLGQAFYEALSQEHGRTTNPSFAEYKIPSARDMPPIECHIIESIDPEGPCGAKGIGEMTQLPTCPAIANAIYDAIGVQIKSLPITPEKILAAIQATHPNSGI